MRQTIIQVDAFTSQPFAGNPAAVCVLEGPADPDWMQAVAREMNLSETAFLYPDPSAGAYRLRWFTPAVEVDLCGHATLASAHVLWEEGQLQMDDLAHFETLSGRLTACRLGDWIEMDFPAEPPGPWPMPPGFSEAIGAEAVAVVMNRHDLLVEVESEAVLRGLAPDFQELAKLPGRGVIATSRAESDEFDFLSRFFAPKLGIDEDPVCGSAHCGLGPYWGSKLGKAQLLGYQCSARGGVVRVRLDGKRLHLGGQAVTVLRAELI
ncbi:PhzF family phenazine biosynthesis protein [soil metagenome]